MTNMIWLYFKYNLNRNQQITFIRQLYYDEKGTSVMKTIKNSRQIQKG